MAVPPARREGQRWPTLSLFFLVLSNILVFQLGGWFFRGDYTYSNVQVGAPFAETAASGILSSDARNPPRVAGPLDVPEGRAIALPSVRVDDSGSGYDRKIYGGKGDKPHLGGFSTGSVDPDGMSPKLWKWMVEQIGVKSLLDVGCGRGVSTSWFHLHGVKTQCVEGSHDAVLQTLLPPEILHEHDFSRGPWWPDETVDAAWSVEVLEHVGRNFHKNLLPSFRKAALIFATHSTWGGWHHVEVHGPEWWINKFESYGFKYSAQLTNEAKGIASKFKTDLMPDGQEYKAQHLWLHMMVFINPMVASLPEHHHLFAEPGCFEGHAQVGGKRTIVHRECGEGKDAQAKEVETPLPDSFKPIKLDDIMDETWERLVFGKTTAERKAAQSTEMTNA